MNITAHHVVACERIVAAPRGPKAVWLPCSAEGASKVSGFATLQKNNDDQDEAIHHEEGGEQSARPAKTDYDDR